MGNYTYGSLPLWINSEEFKSVLKGLGLALAGAAISYFTSDVIPWMKDSGGAMVIVAALVSTGVNFLRKFLLDNSNTVVSK